MTKKKDSTNTNNSLIQLQTPTARIIILLEDNGTQIRSLDTTFHTTSTELDKDGINMNHKLKI
jgi:hypothetical protein